MVAWALDAYQHQRNIFSNIQLGFPHDPLQFGEIRLEDGSTTYWNGHICIDELNFFFDSRRSMKADNIRFSAFLLQQKKQGCNLTGTTHDLFSLDVRLRENFDYIIYPRVWPEYPNRPEILQMTIENGPTQRPISKKITMPCDFLLDLYDTRAVYDPFKNANPGGDSESNQPRYPKGRRVTL